MKYKFLGLIGYNEEEFDELWKDALFVVDTNILINFYRYTYKETTATMNDLLQQIKSEERLFIPYQVALEYMFNYEKEMYTQKSKLEKLSIDLQKLKKEAVKLIRIYKESSHNKTTAFDYYAGIFDEPNQQLEINIQAEIDNLPDPKVIEQNVFELLSGIVGDALKQDEIDQIEETGEERYDNKIPPGFEDRATKSDLRIYGEIKYKEYFGDLLLWEYIIRKAIEKERPIILITNETKEDWWVKEKGILVQPLPNLIQEFYERTGQKFYLYSPEQFIRHAKNKINFKVTEEEIEQMDDDFEILRKNDEQSENQKKEPLDMSEIVKHMSEDEIGVFNTMIERSFEANPQAQNHLYGAAFNWAMNIVIPRMESEFGQKITLLAGHHNGLAAAAHNAYINLPTDNSELSSRVNGLTKILKFINEESSKYDYLD